MKNNAKKTAQLGMPIGTASAKLRKSILFSLLKKANLNYCYQCLAEITSETELSIEHKTPYLDSEDPIKLFFDLDNIGFSHLLCNIGAARKPTKGVTNIPHGTACKYRKGCRCEACTSSMAQYRRDRRTQGLDKYIPSKH